MGLTAKDLKKIRGIGDALSTRLIEEGHDTFAKIVQLGESGLKSIKGINPKAVTDIITQSGQLAACEPSDRDKKIAALKDSLNRLRLSVQGLTAAANERFNEKLSGKTGRKLTESLVSFIEAVESIEETTGKKVKRTGKMKKRCVESTKTPWSELWPLLKRNASTTTLSRISIFWPWSAASSMKTNPATPSCACSKT